MEIMEMTIAGLPIEVHYEHTVENDPYGTGDSPRQHYIDVVGVFLLNTHYEIRDLFEPWMDEIEENILAEVA